MAQEYTARTFKSGNSVAMRLPKGLGIKEGVEMKVREERGRFVVEPVEAPKRKFNVAKVAGSARDLGYIADEDRAFDPRTSEHDGKGGAVVGGT